MTEMTKRQADTIIELLKEIRDLLAKERPQSDYGVGHGGTTNG